MHENPLFQFAEEETEQQTTDSCWKVLIVDDDDFIHQVTKLVLKDLTIEGMSLEVYSAHNTSEAKRLLQQTPDFALAFVDVVMETDHAGLELIKWIRKELQNFSIRLVLRTGQAGTAPEEQVISEYDINDYKEKTELTARKLTTCAYASIRAYRDIISIEKSLNGFKRLVAASTDILKTHSIIEFGTASLEQLFNLLGIECSSLYVANNTESLLHTSERIILGASGSYVGYGYSFNNIEIPSDSKNIIEQAFQDKKSYIDEKVYVGFYQTSTSTQSVLLANFSETIDEFQINLLENYATNLALIFEKVTLREELESAQAELIYILSDSIEMRSKENHAHVKRVSLISHELARLYQCDERLTAVIAHAAPLHDIGKIAISEDILNKPEKLNAEEWAIMQQHTIRGAELLENSQKAIARVAANIAKFHHENWDGSGYPQGLTANDIPIEARIVALADVFDVLGSKRSYKEPWSEDKIVEYLKNQSGIKFEPKLVEIMLKNFDIFRTIRLLNPDNIG
ncbi:HD domain-containing phosphohydrolase [Catenovulum sediminis]|uniref:HD domain-containing phosphohydrolase n=1 Tax=Catenovulum sediminis TaxID=1740262 RepID=A0ABV1RLC1_9ALTE|nr:HD domain-containing phosphohydrolase [Catenovulum sediminis]